MARGARAALNKAADRLGEPRLRSVPVTGIDAVPSDGQRRVSTGEGPRPSRTRARPARRSKPGGVLGAGRAHRAPGAEGALPAASRSVQGNRRGLMRRANPRRRRRPCAGIRGRGARRHRAPPCESPQESATRRAARPECPRAAPKVDPFVTECPANLVDVLERLLVGVVADVGVNAGQAVEDLPAHRVERELPRLPRRPGNAGEPNHPCRAGRRARCRARAVPA